MSKVNSEILDILQEECAEVIQAVSKVKRFGWDNSYMNSVTNRAHLTEEIGDLEAMIELLKVNNEVDVQGVADAKIAKLEKLRRWSNIEL